MINVKFIGLKELEKGLKRNPEVIKIEVANLIQRATAQVRSGIKNNPWTMSSSGGGSPVAKKRGGFLRNSHKVKIQNWRATIKPTAKYAQFVHEGTKKMKARPWLNWVVKDKKNKIDQLSREALKKIVSKI